MGSQPLCVVQACLSFRRSCSTASILIDSFLLSPIGEVGKVGEVGEVGEDGLARPRLLTRLLARLFTRLLLRPWLFSRVLVLLGDGLLRLLLGLSGWEGIMFALLL